ncbi:MAG TPA: hypothetical protein VHE30_29725 [Polyangiaceae bacterium]|nr:hypothetical protein [Polyangiaceae bacterium]
MQQRLLTLVLLALSATACGSNDSHGGSSNPASGSGGSGSGGDGSSWGGEGNSGGAAGGPTLAMDECGLHTQYLGDENCILPPPSDQGFQIHVGPTDYDNPDELYMLQPGDEKTDDIPVTATNDSDVYFFYRQYRLRPSAHHIILSVPNGSDVLAGRRIGTANRSQDYPAGGIIAPEDESVGIPLAAHAVVNASFHAINTGDQPQLREAWINFWYRDAAEVKEPATEWFETGSVTFTVPAHTSQTLGPYTCNVHGDGRMLWLYGHRHANNVRFTATRIRGGQRDVIYDADNWEEPLLLEYSSLVTNPAPDIPNGKEGGWNGILDFAEGDKVEWSCDVVNNHDTDLHFTNQTFLGEMCIVDAEAVGSTCSPF